MATLGFATQPTSTGEVNVLQPHVVIRRIMQLLDLRVGQHAHALRRIAQPQLARILQTKSTAEWSAILEKADVPVMPMHDLESLLEDPHIVATDVFPVTEHPTEGRIRNMKVSARWSETKAEPQRLAPRLGQHSEAILLDAGFSPEEIAAMLRDGVTKAPGT